LQPRAPEHGLGRHHPKTAAGHGRIALLLGALDFGGITAAQNLNLPKLRDDLVGLVSLVCHCGPPSGSKPYFKVDPFNGGGSGRATHFEQEKIIWD
ncbi:MAG: hypothetical protein ACK4L7_12445, partial [Flavobacteriales bacterium]